MRTILRFHRMSLVAESTPQEILAKLISSFLPVPELTNLASNPAGYLWVCELIGVQHSTGQSCVATNVPALERLLIDGSKTGATVRK